MPAPTEEPDASLVARCQRGEAAAWQTLVQRYQRLVYAVARRAGMDEHTAADVFQVVFTRLVEHLPRLRDADKLQAWIVTTAKREVLAHWRRSKRTVSMTASTDDNDDAADFDVADDAAIPEEMLADLQQVHRLRLALERMDERCRTLLKLVFRDEDEVLPYDEVARQLGMPVGSIGPTRARCLGKLRGLLA
jgi:RNA polymerase sigma factor (sigma-70 family)